MFPILWRIPDYIPLLGGIPIYSYGVMVALAFLSAVLWAKHEAKLAGLDQQKIADLSFYLILSAIVGSRVLYIITEWQRFAADPLAVFKLWEGGLVFYGGLLACLATSWWYARRNGWTLRQVADVMMPAVALGHAIGRWGCVFAGCCYGRPVEGHPWWALTFPHTEVGIAPAGIPLVPTQILESFAELTIFFILVVVRRHKKFEGQVFFLYLSLYAVARSILEIFRGDAVRGFVIPGVLSTSQFISVLVVIACGVAYLRMKKNVSP